MRNLWPRSFKPRLEKQARMGDVPGATKNEREPIAESGCRTEGLADQRGHGLGVSMEVYTISDLQQKRSGVRKLEAMISRARKARKSA